MRNIVIPAAANHLRKLHYYLGIPSIFLSTLVGTSIFATLGNTLKLTDKLSGANDTFSREGLS